MSDLAMGLAELERLPLLGSGLQRALALLAELAAEAVRGADQVLERRLLALGAEVALAAEEPDAVQRLTEAAHRAEAAGDTATAQRLRLLTCRALAAAQRPDAARELLQQQGAVDDPALLADWHLARAACAGGDAREQLQAALSLLPSPARDHDRFSTLLRLADLHQLGGDRPRTRVLLDQARELARQHDDAVGACHTAALLGNLLLESGLPAEAVSHLRQAVALAEELGDMLTVVAEGAVLASVLLQRGETAGALAVSDLVWQAARRRRNWLGVADAAITGAACLHANGDLSGALRRLVRGIAAAREGGSPAAELVLKARLAELRAAMGAEVFDPPFAAALEGFRSA